MSVIEPETAGETGYGGIAKALHWLIAFLLVAQFTVAWTMPDIHRGVEPVGLIGLHFSFGVVILALACLRLIWRLFHAVPLLAEGVPAWQNGVAWATHALLYLLLLVLPLMGWGNASSRGLTVNLFGFWALPPLLPAGSAFGRELGGFHVWTAYALLGLIGLHVAAALYHHFWLRDRVLLRMSPLG
jgi:cytochrome b561